MSNNTTSLSSLTAEQVSTVLVEPLAAASRFLSSGPSIYSTAGPLRIPIAPTFNLGTVSWTGEGESIDDVDAGKRQVALLPSSMKSVKVITKYTRELARQSVVQVESALRSGLVSEVARKLDARFFAASGGDGTTVPKGMFEWAGTQNVSVGGSLALDDLLTAQGKALAANVDMDRLRLFIRPEHYTALRGLTGTDGRPLLQPDATKGGVASVLGTGVVVTPALPSGYAALADMSQVAVARDVDADVTILTERYADTDEIGIRVVTRYDLAPLNPAAIVTLSGVTGAATSYQVTIDENVSTFVLTLNGKQSAAIDDDETAANVRSALAAIDDGIAAEDITVTGDPGGPLTVVLANGGTLSGVGTSGTVTVSPV